MKLDLAAFQKVQFDRIKRHLDEAAKAMLHAEQILPCVSSERDVDDLLDHLTDLKTAASNAIENFFILHGYKEAVTEATDGQG